jgi:hypothetical protein
VIPGVSGTQGGVQALSGHEPQNPESAPFDRDAGDMIERKPFDGSGDGHGAAIRPVDEARLRQQAIGVRLRQMFDAVVNEDVPDEFLDILRRADDRSKDPNRGGG